MNETVTVDQQGNAEPPASAVTIATAVYALHSVAILLGIFGAVSVIGAFLASPFSIIAVILNYVNRSAARGTWVESHYSWQIRTFWFTLLWLVIALVLIATFIGMVFGFPILIVLTVWVIYRIGRGWLRLGDRRPI